MQGALATKNTARPVCRESGPQNINQRGVQRALATKYKPKRYSKSMVHKISTKEVSKKRDPLNETQLNRQLYKEHVK